MQGLYLWTKMQLLISFYLLKPLWAGLAWLLSQVRGVGGDGQVSMFDNTGWKSEMQWQGVASFRRYHMSTLEAQRWARA